MLKLRHLFNNVDLAEMLLKNWRHDKPSAQLFGHFRISSNAIYPFRRDGQICFLRFCPKAEKHPQVVTAELHFIHYLRSRDYLAPQIILSDAGQQVVQQETPWGTYLATAFRSSGDNRLDSVQLTDEVVTAFGQSLATLHNLSRGYTKPRPSRWSHIDVLDWIGSTLGSIPGEERALTELYILKEFFSSLPADAESYGLVHYDFELDNVFYEPMAFRCSPIDFDDSMYHWYVSDIDQSLDSLMDKAAGADFLHLKSVFLDGYAKAAPLQDSMLSKLPVFRRFANLYGYTRIVRSVEETWSNEPDWMQGLRKKLSVALGNRSVSFATPIEG